LLDGGRRSRGWGPANMASTKQQLSYGLGGLGVILGGLGVFLISERGREVVRGIARNFDRAPESLEQWSDVTQSELDRIQQTLDRIAAQLSVAG
jgi:hypothetical protein